MAEVTNEVAKYFPIFFLSSMMSVGLVPLYIGLTQEKAKEVAMNGHAREGEERGKGIPLDDPERVARHYSISIEEACDLLRVYSVEELVPERGYGLTTSSPASLTGSSISELSTALNLMEDSLKPGNKARLEITTFGLPTKDELDIFWLDALYNGFNISRPKAKVVDGIPLTTMVLTKGSPAWALLIPLIVPILTMGLIAFGIVKLEAISKAILPIILATGGLAVIALGIMRQPAARAAELAAGKYLK